MELVILSSIATVAILVAELRDLAGREHIGRSTVAASAPRLAIVTELASAGAVANQDAVVRAELDRAA